MATQGRAEYRGMALCAALFGVAMAAVVLISGPRDEPAEVVLQVIATTLAALSFVTAEALWAMRPWAYRAARTLAIGTVAAFLLPGVAMLARGQVPMGLFALTPGFAVGFVTLPMLRYLERHAPRRRVR